MCFFNDKLTAVALGMVFLTLFTGCQSPSGIQVPSPVRLLPKSTVKIDAIRQPQSVERSVALAGSVTQRLALLDGWLYQLDDGTGNVWILTQQAAPPKVGQQVYVDGVLRYEAIPINGADVGDYYLEEKQWQLQSPETP